MQETVHTSQMMSFQMINACEAPLTDRAAKVLLGGLHGCPSGRRSGVLRERVIKSGEEKVQICPVLVLHTDVPRARV